MYKFGNNNSNSNFRANGLARNVAHSRIEDEETIYKKYELGQKLGQGSFGVVYEIRNKETDEKFAIKIITKEKTGKTAISFENEVNIMKSVTHKNLIKLEEVFETKKKLYLITELCEAGELAKWLKKQKPIKEDHARIIMRQIVEAISYLHKNDIVHRDLKLENILIKEFDADSENFLIKITDFGLSSQRDSVGTESMFEDYCGTPLYMAPEIIDNNPYSQLCDVWALGIIMFFILTSHSPFSAENESKLREQIRNAEINTSLSSYIYLSPEAKDCLSRMIKVNPAHRITSSELFSHAWFMNKKLNEMESSKNVLELMKEFREEQENLSLREHEKLNGDKAGVESVVENKQAVKNLPRSTVGRANVRVDNKVFLFN
ncbi:serine threonine- kinase 33-like [Brachionus plicatilis]|uniref:Serine threonine-kinase 33-like n=1 Tax=Brachionus plicatilis TaxID=10195 RepID=A0A3M7QFL7_BRAPC|nr:serine threonine- kinase 33-like [Brachionus plicatilis]